MFVGGGTGKTRVLLIEDESLVAMLIEEMLVDRGFDVVGVVSQLATGMQFARDHTFDCAVLDVNLDGQYSYPIAELLRARGIPFLFVTGYGSGGLEPEFKHAPVLAKPFTMADLGAALERLMNPQR